jgi:hypothetical protein
MDPITVTTYSSSVARLPVPSRVAARQRHARPTFQRVWHLRRDVDLASERLNPLERFLRRGPVTEGELRIARLCSASIW